MSKEKYKSSKLFEPIGDKKIVYQKYFEEILDRIDLDNYTNFARSRSHDENKIKDDNYIIAEIEKNAEKEWEVNPLILSIILMQYFAADERAREFDKGNWIDRVMHREDIDYFPDPNAVYKLFFAGVGLDQEN